jgi:hypothetical protein
MSSGDSWLDSFPFFLYLFLTFVKNMAISDPVQKILELWGLLGPD